MAAFANQVDYCRANEAPVTAAIVEAVATVLTPNTAFGVTVLEWEGDPLADALPLRCAAALRSLHLAGKARILDPIYRGTAEPDEAQAAVAAMLAMHGDALLPWLDGPPQTNEAGRSSGYVAAMLWLASKGLPPRFELIEFGSSAGINLMLDRYAYDLGGVHVGPDEAAVSLAPDWRGSPPPDEPIEIVSAWGCDVAPIDLTSERQRRRLAAFIWPEQKERLERLKQVTATARARPPKLVEAEAADFVEAQLVRPQDDGVTRLLVHSITWQYLPRSSQQRIQDAMAQAGKRATAARPLGWVRLEADREILRHVLEVQYWPGGEQVTRLAEAHAHGRWLEWQA